MAKLQHGDKVIYDWWNNRFIKIGHTMSNSFLKANFVIVCEYGDWSGFRTLNECLSQEAELTAKNKPDGWYAIVER